jgi:hypothetical protein
MALKTSGIIVSFEEEREFDPYSLCGAYLFGRLEAHCWDETWALWLYILGIANRRPTSRLEEGQFKLQV